MPKEKQLQYSQELNQREKWCIQVHCSSICATCRCTVRMTALNISTPVSHIVYGWPESLLIMVERQPTSTNTMMTAVWYRELNNQPAMAQKLKYVFFWPAIVKEVTDA